MDKLIFERPKPVETEPRQRGTSVIRISNEALGFIDTISAKTGKSMVYIATQMIKFAFENTEII
jgi:predicted DNA-binding protein